MPKKKRSTTRKPSLSRRTQYVWGTFLVAMTLVTWLLANAQGDHQARPGFLATNVGELGVAPAADPIFQLSAPIDTQRWQGIVIHHTGSPAGDPDSLHKLHQSYGYRNGLGYHFVIGNGNGMGDGLVHVGHRWDEQNPGAHTAGDNAAFFNEHCIGICLVGNGDRRPFTELQIARLMSLIQRLQQRFNIPAEAVFLHRDVAGTSKVTGPGKFFPKAQLEQSLWRFSR